MPELAFGPYIKTAQSVRRLFAGSPNLVAEFDRAIPARTATPQQAAAYLMINPEPYAPEERDEDGFGHLVDHAGPDAWRMRAVDPMLFGNSVKVLPVGGSCAIETWGMRTVERERHEANRISLVAERLLAMAPTFTHATGAFLTGGPHGVHFIENRLWAARLTEWGVPGASEKVLAAYDRIHDAVVRRARLINPEADITAMSFDDLGLRDGPIARWCEDMGLPDDPNFGVSEVLYTYCGPELIDLVTRNLLNSGHDWAKQVTHLFRLKQVDHNDWDSSFSTDAKSALLCGLTPPSDSPHATLAASAIARWVRKNAAKNRSRVSGFFDTPYNNGPLHMVPKLPSADTSVDGQLDSPARLWHGNLEAHLAFLQTALVSTDGRVVDEAAIRAGAEQKRQRGEAERTLKQAQATITNKETQLAEFARQARLFAALLRGERPTSDLQTTAELLDKRMHRHLTSFADRELSELDREDRDQILALREDLAGDTLRPELWSALVQKFDGERDGAVQLAERQLTEAREAHTTAQQKLATLDASTTRSNTVRPVTMSLYPLHNNLFVCYATQFLFHPDFRAFLRAVAEVDESDAPKADKQREVRRLCGVIYPKLAAFLTYIMVGGVYPSEMRNSRVF